MRIMRPRIVSVGRAAPRSVEPSLRDAQRGVLASPAEFGEIHPSAGEPCLGAEYLGSSSRMTSDVLVSPETRETGAAGPLLS